MELLLPKYELSSIIKGKESLLSPLVDCKDSQEDIMPIRELSILCKIVQWKKPDVVFEIGTYLGGTTLHLAANSQAKVYTLDLPLPEQKKYVKSQTWDPELDVYPNQPGIKFHNTPFSDRIHQLLGDSQTYDFTPYHGEVDLVFIDACHHYEFVLQDSRNALKIMSTKGILVWHDYAPYAPGVVQALHEINNIIPLVNITDTSIVISYP